MSHVHSGKLQTFREYHGASAQSSRAGGEKMRADRTHEIDRSGNDQSAAAAPRGIDGIGCAAVLRNLRRWHGRVNRGCELRLA